jgi:hypothetical protein
MPTRFIVLTYNRPRALQRLLIDLREEGAQDVVVYDDGSTADYSSAQRFIKAQGWQFVRFPHHGKRDFWRLLGRIHEAQVDCAADWFVFLADDVRLCCGFAARLRAAWESISDSKKIAINVLRDSGREGKVNWTGCAAQTVSALARHTAWIDGLFAAPRAYLEALEFRGVPVPDYWFAPDRSSGAYRSISIMLHQQGYGMYQTAQSLVVHTTGASVMQAEIREREPLRALHYVDGDDAEARLASPGDERAVAIATLPDRVDLLGRVVETLHDQVDRLCIYLNGHDEIPAFLRAEKIVYERGDNRFGDAAKFWWAATASGYYLTCDDDILYPADYVERLVDAVETYQRRAIVGVMGRTLRQPITRFYRSYAERYDTGAGLDENSTVHIVGSGTLAYFAPALPLTMDDFPVPNMADIWVALAARRRGMPRVAVHRSAGWLQILSPPPGTTIYERFYASGDDSKQTEAAQRGAPWEETAPAQRALIVRPSEREAVVG